MDDSASDEDCQAVDVYDMATEDLKARLAAVEQAVKEEGDAARKAKLRKLAEVMQLEVEERAMATDFEENCERILGSWDAVAQEVDSLLEKNKHMLLNEVQEEPEYNYSETVRKENRSRVVLPELDHKRLVRDDTPASIQQNSSRLSRSTSSSRAATSTQHSDYNMRGEFDTVDESMPPSNYHRKHAVGKAGWLNFVKNTLNTTKVVEQTVNVGLGAFKRPPRIGRSSKEQVISNSRGGEKVQHIAVTNLDKDLKKQRREASKAYGEATRIKNTNPTQKADTNAADHIPEQTEVCVSAGKSIQQTLKQRNTKCSSVRRVPETDTEDRHLRDLRKADDLKRDPKKYRISKQKSHNSLYSADRSTKDSCAESQSKPATESRKTRETKGDHNRKEKNPEVFSTVPIEPESETLHLPIPLEESYCTVDHYYFEKVNDRAIVDAFETIEASIDHFSIKKAQIKPPLKPQRNPLKAQSSNPRGDSRHQSSKRDTVKEDRRELIDKSRATVKGNELKVKCQSECVDVSGEKRGGKRAGRESGRKGGKEGKGGAEKGAQEGVEMGAELGENEVCVREVEKEEVVVEAKKKGRVNVGQAKDVVKTDKSLQKTVKQTENPKSAQQESKEEFVEKAIQQVQLYRNQKSSVKQMLETGDLRTLLPEPLDYSDQIPTWNHVFSETYCHKTGYDPDILGVMREVIKTNCRYIQLLLSTTTSSRK